jgi:hypothetical protein
MGELDWSKIKEIEIDDNLFQIHKKKSHVVTGTQLPFLNL